MGWFVADDTLATGCGFVLGYGARGDGFGLFFDDNNQYLGNGGGWVGKVPLEERGLSYGVSDVTNKRLALTTPSRHNRSHFSVVPSQVHTAGALASSTAISV